MKPIGVASKTLTLVIGLILPSFCNSKIDKNWNHCPLQSEATIRVPKASLDECLKQCSKRNHCQLICYRTKLKLCEIYETIDTMSSCRSCVSVIREDTLAEKFGPACGCDDGQTCTAPSGLCDFTECGKLLDPFLEIIGNLAYVGAKKRAGCKEGFIGNSTIVTCGNEGQWVNQPACEMCPTDGIINVTDSFRIKIFSQTASQPEAHDTCKQACGALAKMDQRDKIERVIQLVKSSTEFTNAGYWVDGYSPAPSNPTSWKFSDGAQMTMDKYVFWASHAPNHGTPACTRLSKQSNYLMDDTGCDSSFHFICEMQ